MSTNVDQSQIKAALTAALVGNGAWSDLLATSGGDAILDLLATAGSFPMYTVERAFAEAFTSTALLDSSRIDLLRTLGGGVRYPRSLPASMRVQVKRPATGLSLAVPAYSAWSVRGVKLFNRDALVFTPGATAMTVTLYQGEVHTAYLQGLGTDHQTFNSSETGFTISDQDVVVTVADTPIPVVTDGLWNYKGEIVNGQWVPNHAVRDMTTGDGRLELTFGTAKYGTRPAESAAVSVVYATTRGKAGNNTSLKGETVTTEASAELTGTALTGLTGGANHPSISDYARSGPYVGASFGRAVSGDQYHGLANDYPGVIDAQIWSQRLLAPTDDRWSRLMRIVLLTDSEWGDTQRADFQAWYARQCGDGIRFFWASAYPYDYTVRTTVYCAAGSDLTTIKKAVVAALEEATAPRRGWLGRTLYKQELTKVISSAHPRILYATLGSPTEDAIVCYQPVPEFTATEGTGGSIGQETVTYKITTIVTLADGTIGESLPATVTIKVQNKKQTITKQASVRLTYPEVAGITGYRVYVVRNGITGRLATLTPSARSWVDTGANPTPATIPTADTLPVRWPRCTDIQVNTAYAAGRNGVPLPTLL